MTMNLPDWLDADRGRLTALANHFGLTQSAVSQWRAKGVPVNRMKAVRDFTSGDVTLEEMIPSVAETRPATPAPAASRAEAPAAAAHRRADDTSVRGLRDTQQADRLARALGLQRRAGDRDGPSKERK